MAIKRSVMKLMLGLPLVVTACAPRSSEVPAAEPVWRNPTVAEELRLGRDSGPREYVFGAIEDVAVAPNGMMYVRERQPVASDDGASVLIRAYNSRGDYVGDVGSVGEGPGEYQRPVLRVLPDGRLAIWDLLPRRVSFYSSDGVYESSVSIGGTAAVFHTDVAGSLYVQATVQEGDSARRVLKKYSQGGELLGSVPLPAATVATVANPGVADFVLGPEGDLRPFNVRTLYSWSPLGYVVVGRNDTYEVELLKPGGVVRLSRDVEPAAVLPAEHVEWNQFRTRVIQLNEERGIHYEIVSIPTEKPFFRELLVGEDGRVWVFRYVAATKKAGVEPLPDRPGRPLLTWREPPTFDVFEADGSFLGAVVLPEQFRPLTFRGTRVWGVHADPTGAEYILRLRIVHD